MPGASGWPASPCASSGGLRKRAAEHAFDFTARQAAGTQQHRRLDAPDDAGFDADFDCTAIDDQVDPPRKIALHMRRPWSATHGPTN